jgi:hypothetical protein
VGELTKHVGEVSRKVASDTVSAAAAGLLVAVGAATNNHDLVVMSVPAGAIAGGVTDQAALFAQRIWTDRVGRVVRFVQTAESESGHSIGDLIQGAVEHEPTRDLLLRAVDAASRSLDQRKIELLARLYVATEEDPARVDEAVLLVDALRQIESMHLRVVRILARPGPRLLPPTDQEKLERQRVAASSGDATPGGVWPVEEILSQDPGLRPGFSVLIARLVSLGLVYDEGPGRIEYQPFWELTQFGWNCARYLRERGSSQHPA